MNREETKDGDGELHVDFVFVVFVDVGIVNVKFYEKDGCQNAGKSWTLCNVRVTWSPGVKIVFLLGLTMIAYLCGIIR